jgi:hypothetical protein
VAGVTTRRSEEPYVNSTSTVLWEVPGVTRALTRFFIFGENEESFSRPHKSQENPSSRAGCGELGYNPGIA